MILISVAWADSSCDVDGGKYETVTDALVDGCVDVTLSIDDGSRTKIAAKSDIRVRSTGHRLGAIVVDPAFAHTLTLEDLVLTGQSALTDCDVALKATNAVRATSLTGSPALCALGGKTVGTGIVLGSTAIGSGTGTELKLDGVTATSLEVPGVIAVSGASVKVADGAFTDVAGALVVLAADLVVEGGTFDANVAPYGADILADAGTVTVLGTSASPVTFTGAGATADEGGGIWTADADLSLTDVTATGYSATDGAFLRTRGGTIAAVGLAVTASAAAEGGALYLADTNGTIEMSQFTGTTADRGGAIVLEAVVGASLTISHTAFDAHADRGAAIAAIGSTLETSWDAFYHTSSARVSEGGAVWCSGCTWRDDWGTYADLAATEGGAAWLDAPRDTSWQGTYFAGNIADDGGVAWMRDATGTWDGLDAYGCSFLDNHANDAGGVIHASVTDTSLGLTSVILYSSSADGNSATDGGVVHLDGVDLLANDVRFCDNVATAGGAVHATDGRVYLGWDRFVRNDALSGSAVYSAGGGGVQSINNTYAGNRYTGSRVDDPAPGSAVMAPLADLAFINNIVVDGEWAIELTSGTATSWSADNNLVTMEVAYEGDPYGLLPRSTDLVGLDPMFVAYSPARACDAVNLRLRPGSPAIDAGQQMGTDDVPTDIGAYGGSRHDTDEDGYFYEIDDCDDGDPDVHPGAPDPAGDGIDSDCDGEDGVAADTDETDDTGVPADTDGETDETDAARDTDPAWFGGRRCGCESAGSTVSPVGLLLILAAFRRTRQIFVRMSHRDGTPPRERAP